MTSKSAIPSIAEDEAVLTASFGAVDEASSNGNPKTDPRYSRLSTVSRMYDVNGDGALNAAELAMRDMDQSGRGYLTNDKVYKMMQDQIEVQKQLFRVKRIMFVLLALVVILAISNLGTSFAAASLAKDTTISSNEEIVDKKTDEGLSTQSSSSSIEIQRTPITSEGGRKLCNKDDGDVDCTLSEIEGSILTMNKRMCKKLFKQCNRGNTVTLIRPWRNGDQSDYEICPSTGTISRYNNSTLTNKWGETFEIEPIGDGHCEISGGAVRQKKGRICEVGNDCASGLGCRKVEQFISGCQRRCAMRRFAQHMVEQCQLDCDHPSCQTLEAEY